MNIDNSPLLQDCSQLIESILSESQPEHKYILAIITKADHQGVIHHEPRSLYPNFYGYTMDRTKNYLMINLKITSNTSGGGLPNAEHGLKIMTDQNLNLCEHRLNLSYIKKSFYDLRNELGESKWAWITNTSPYQSAELIIIFRDKAKEFLKTQNNGNTFAEFPSEFQITIRDREIWINSYIIAKPHAVGSNLEFFEYILSQPINKQIVKENLDNYLQKSLGDKDFFKIINALGFKKEITKAFYYKVSRSTLYFRGKKVTLQQLIDCGINIKKFIKELEDANAKYNPV